MAQPILPLIINGWTAPMHSSYNFFNKKVYIKSPTRSNAGNLVFNKRIYVPFFTVGYNYMAVEDYNVFMSHYSQDEVNVRYYDTETDTHKTAKFAMIEPDYDRLLSKSAQFNGIVAFKISFDGTLN